MCCWVRARPGSPGLERTVPAVAFIEDANIAASGEPITEVAQFLERSRRVRQHVILKLGVSAVFELAANPVAGPTWVRSVYEAAGADHLLHMLDTPVDECRRRVHERNATKPEDPRGAATSSATSATGTFDGVCPLIVPPSAAEGFRVIASTWRPLRGVVADRRSRFAAERDRHRSRTYNRSR